MIILIVLVAWMQPKEYHVMDVEVSKVCIGVQYKNLWYVKEVEHLKEFSLQVWLYWEALQAAAMKISHLS